MDDIGGVAADGGAGLQAQLGGWPGRSVNHGGDAETGDVLLFEKAIDECVQEGVVVTEEDADGEESGGAEEAFWVAKATQKGFGARHQNLGATYVAAQPGL